MSTQLYPQVRDATALGALFAGPHYLTIAVEGQMNNVGTAVEGVPVTIAIPGDADTLFGVGSSLAVLVKFVLDRGIEFVRAIPSKKGAAPLLADRQEAWEALASEPNTRVILTDSVTQADLAMLADVCEAAEQAQNKVICFVGLASGSDSATLITAAGAIASKRAVLVGPGIYDQNGVLRSGAFAAAAAAAEVAKNPDIADDLDTLPVPGLTGIERTVEGAPLFREKISGLAYTNDHEALLQAGVSPLREGRSGGVEITHLRMTFTTDSTFDALMTRLIEDQLFIVVRSYLEGQKYLRRGNTQTTRDDMKAGVEALLEAHDNWITKKTQADGSISYGVSVIPTSDKKGVIIGAQGEIVRNLQTITFSPVWTILA